MTPSELITRGTVFLLWGGIGAVLTYGSLYAFTPFGLALIATCVAAAVLVPRIGFSRWPEVLGLVGGPGVFCFVVARNSDDPVQWIVAGASFVVVALLSYAVAGRARCARNA